jgi:hypothetical protein
VPGTPCDRLGSSVYKPLGNVRRGTIALSAFLSIAPVVTAQTITDARRVEFTPSADHSAVDPSTGVQLVTNYTLDVYVAGDTTSLQTANLGKPIPDADGMIRVDFVALLSTALTPGTIYETVVSAVGPGGAAASPRSNTFAFSAPCPPTVTPANQSFGATGGSGSTTVTASAGCAWTAASNAAWIMVTAGSVATGTSTVSFTVASNTGAASRTGTLTVGATTFTVTQSGLSCSPTISPASRTLTAASAATGTVTVAVATGCAWTAVSNSSWITINAAPSGSGNGSVSYTVASNPTTSSRSGTVTIAGKPFTVTQAGSCAFTISPTSKAMAATGGIVSVTVTTSAGCTWSTTNSASWITITGAIGTGSGTVRLTAASNSTSLTRNATLTIAGNTFVVTEPTALPATPSNLRILK